MGKVNRPAQWPTINAFIQVMEAIELGPSPTPVGFDESPGCAAPYFIVTLVNELTDGSMESPEADSSIRIQVIAVGVSGDQATQWLDKAREALTREAMNALLTARHVMDLRLDVNRGTNREERGLPEPLISKIDQYIIETTPIITP